jgi:DEAD/DEAH box helicase
MESTSLTSFDGFGLNDAIARAIAEEKYVTPTQIQVQTIPVVMSRRDVIGIAQTGTGKTAAFALPILQQLAANPRAPERKSCRVLVLSPTRDCPAKSSTASAPTAVICASSPRSPSAACRWAHRCARCWPASMFWSRHRGGCLISWAK